MEAVVHRAVLTGGGSRRRQWLAAPFLALWSWPSGGGTHSGAECGDVCARAVQSGRGPPCAWCRGLWVLGDQGSRRGSQQTGVRTAIIVTASLWLLARWGRRPPQRRLASWIWACVPDKDDAAAGPACSAPPGFSVVWQRERGPVGLWPVAMRGTCCCGHAHAVPRSRGSQPGAQTLGAERMAGGPS